MNWYFNNQGLADGPHDEADMRAQVKTGVVTAQTLVWQGNMEVWQEAAPLNAPWWQPVAEGKPVVVAGAAAAVKEGVPARPETQGLRKPVPMAPTEEATKPSKMTDFFKKLFRRGDEG